MAGFLQLLAYGVACWAWAVFTVAIAAIRSWRRLMRRERSAAAGAGKTGRVLLIRPCAGDEPSLLRCLGSLSSARYSFDVDLVFGVNGEDDKALPAIRAACRILESAGIAPRIEVAPVTGPNRKVTILSHCARASGTGYDAIVNADSNVDLTGHDLDRLVAPILGSREVGAVWAPPIESAAVRAPGNRASEAVLHGSWHAFGLLRAIDPRGMVGKLVALRPSALEAIGGFEPLVDFLGEDMELSRRFRRAGFRVESDSEPAHSVSGPKPWREALDRQFRWMMVLRAQRAWLLIAYPLLFCSAPLICLASLPAAFADWPVAAAAAGLALITRALVGCTARRASGSPGGCRTAIIDAALADSLMLLAFVRCLFTRRLIWRGVPLRIGPGGRLYEA